MPDTQTSTVLSKIKEIATIAGMKAGIDDDRECVVTGFQFPDGRSQGVYIRHAGQAAEGKDVITFFSPALPLKRGFMSGMSKERAIDLLIRNENMLFARFGLWRADKADMIVVSVDQLLDTMDPDEFMAHTAHVAMAADAYEKEHGVDNF